MSHSDELGALYKKDEEAYLKLVGETIKTTKTVSSDNRIINLRKKIDQLGVRGFSEAPVNYSIDKEGNASYLDSFDAWKFENDGLPHLFFDFETLENEINSLSENDKKTALNFLQRLRELYGEERDEDKKEEKTNN